MSLYSHLCLCVHSASRWVVSQSLAVRRHFSIIQSLFVAVLCYSDCDASLCCHLFFCINNLYLPLKQSHGFALLTSGCCCKTGRCFVEHHSICKTHSAFFCPPATRILACKELCTITCIDGNLLLPRKEEKYTFLTYKHDHLLYLSSLSCLGWQIVRLCCYWPL